MEADNSAPANTQTTNSQQFPGIFSLHKESWEALKRCFVTIVTLGIIPIVIFFVLGVMGGILGTVTGGQSETEPGLIVLLMVGGLIGVIAAIYVSPAITYAQIQAVRGKKVSVKEAFEYGKPLVGQFFIMSILVGIVILVGFILLIVPGLFMLRRYILTSYHLVDKKLSATEAMKVAHETAKKYNGVHWGIIGLQLVIQLVSYIPLVGWLVSLVMSVVYYLAPTVRYEQVTKAG